MTGLSRLLEGEVSVIDIRVEDIADWVDVVTLAAVEIDNQIEGENVYKNNQSQENVCLLSSQIGHSVNTL